MEARGNWDCGVHAGYMRLRVSVHDCRSWNQLGVCQVDGDSRHGSVGLEEGTSPGLCERLRGKEMLGMESMLGKDIGLLNSCSGR
jgi:hypothetical protein